MKKKINIAILMVIAALMIGSCKKPYAPKPITANSNYLVVEGHINSGGAQSVIHLSRTVPLSSTSSSNPELNATVSVAGDNFELVFFSLGNGTYYQNVGDLSTFKNLRLKIVTDDGKVYESDVIPVKNSPPIDSVYYRIQKDGLHIYADAHDATNSTRYYRWDYQETFIIHSAYYSYYVYDPAQNAIVLRNPANQIYQCWRTDSSSNILLGSSEKLIKDIVSGNPIAYIPSTSEKLNDRYSILVNQYAMSADEYEYYVQVKKITEQLGSIFDAQPSQIKGNIHCMTTPLEPVIGFIGAGATAQQRIFIDSRSLPGLGFYGADPSCSLDTLYYSNPTTHFNDVAAEIYSGNQLPVNAVSPPGSPPIGFSAAPPECVDCRLRGTNIQPDFWR